MNTVSFLEQLANTPRYQFSKNHLIHQQSNDIKEAFEKNDFIGLKKQLSHGEYWANPVEVIREFSNMTQVVKKSYVANKTTVIQI